jgi:integrating conjugative element protein (TIGR03755 family)
MTGALALGCVSTASVAAPPAVTKMTRQNSSLYYLVGGGDPSPLSANPNSINLKFGLSGNAFLSYSCGKFSVGDAFSYYMSEFRNLGSTITAAIGAAVAALPMYVFQRAQPGLYEIFQSYWAKAQVAISAALKTCEEMEAQIKAGQNPYDDYIQLAKGEGWKFQANSGNNVIRSKEEVAANGGRSGVQAWQGLQKGGRGQEPLRLVHDTAVVGYNATMNKLPATDKDIVYPPTNRLANLWSSPRAAADWGVSVLGDQEITTCEDPDCGRADGGTGKSLATGLGLQPKYEASVVEVTTAMNALVTTGDTSYANLLAASAPGVGIGKDLIDALRRLPPETRETMTARVAREVALAKTIERAFMLRNLLLTGMTAANYEKPVDDARKRVEQLNRYIDDLMFEQRVRKEIVSTTAQLLLENDRSTAAARSSAVPEGREATVRPLEDGRVRP